MRQNQHLDYKYLVDRLVSVNFTDSEKAELDDYIQNSFNNDELNSLIQKHWQELESMKFATDDIQLLILKNRILSKIHQTKISPEKPTAVFYSNWKNYLIRIVAILFIPLLLSSLYVIYQLKQNTEVNNLISLNERVIAHPGSRVHFTLPDNTEVWLNSASALEFPLLLKSQKIRKVKLTGQGYFNVSHDEKHPFIVEADGMNIKALGTSFDVSSYAEDNQISSTLENGSIAMTDLDGIELARIHPGQKAILDRTTRLVTIKNVESKLFTSWKDGKLIFKNTPLAEVAKQMERWFNCKIFVDPHLLNTRLVYTASIQDENLGEVIKMIEISTSVNTKIENRNVYITKKN
jgi:transmembrane sensor